jgi:hypothetical protein
MAITPPTDDQLNTFIRARLALVGIDLETLPVSDSSAPSDQTRILSSLRSFLRSNPGVISNYVADVQENPPVLYPAPFSEWTDE